MSQTMKPVDEVAKHLAEAHKRADPDIQQIYMVEDPTGAEVRLALDPLGNLKPVE